MGKRTGLALAAAALLASASALHASSDSTCYAGWTLQRGDFSCESVAAIAPGNDSRVNLFLLQRDSLGTAMAGTAYPAPGWDDGDFGHVFFDWSALHAAFSPPRKEGEEDDFVPSYGGSRCDTFDLSLPPFTAALAANRKLSPAERAALSAQRAALPHDCLDNGTPALFPAFTLPEGVSSREGKDFAAYVHAAGAFYAGDWDTARSGFAALTRASDPWVAETATYMIARTDLHAAITHAFDEWGGFEGPQGVDQATVTRARSALGAYIAAYPRGRYSVSAQGLLRRAYWLAGDRAALSGEYERLLAGSGADPLAALKLVEEIDNKLLTAPESAGSRVEGPLLLAAIDLMRMRQSEGDETPPIGLDELTAQESAFSENPELYGYVLASHAYYVARDMKRVLALIPDDARLRQYAPLAFSRQVLRGMALAKAGDRNEGGFWRELLAGAGGLYQRPLVELGLAMHLERHGQLAAVFAPGSPITEPEIRRILIEHSAGPDLLRRQAANLSLPAAERKAALSALLYKQLSRGAYAAFVADVGMAAQWPAPVEDPDNWVRGYQADPHLFAGGKWAEDYACPAIAQTAATLAARPRDARGLLCLGEFYRLNGFDLFELYDTAPGKDDLGGVANEFPGTATARGAFYPAIIADPRASPDDKAYAYYRAIRCYAPGGNNSCGGEDVEEAQRRAWFQQLKQKYPASRWARALKFYW